MNTSMKQLKLLALSSVLFFTNMAMAEQKVDETLAAASNGILTIEMMNGAAKINGWDKNEVKVTGHLSDKVEKYEFVREGDRILFKVDVPKSEWNEWQDDDSQLTFYLPVNNQVRFEGMNASIVLSDVAGGSRINTVNGDITASNLKDRIKLATVNGNVSSKGLVGKIELSTINGKINDEKSEGELNLTTINGEIQTSSIAKELKLSNVNGDIKTRLTKINELDVSTVNGEVELELELTNHSDVSISSVSGDVEVKLAGKVSARVNIETHAGGDIENKLTKERAKESRYGPGRSLQFKVGDGAASIDISTVSGDVEVK